MEGNQRPVNIESVHFAQKIKYLQAVFADCRHVEVMSEVFQSVTVSRYL